jgi:two-component system, OmpR family, sensor histidine kinase KdpD
MLDRRKQASLPLWIKTLQIYTLVFLAIALMTVCAYIVRATLTLANFMMLYLLLVLIIAIRAGTLPALVSGIISFICINFFLVPPYYSLRVADPREVLDLVVFVIVAGIAGRLGAQVRQQAYEARQRAREQEILYQLTRAFNQLMDREGVYLVLKEVFRNELGAVQIDILPYSIETSDNRGTTYYLLLQAGEKIYATVRVVFDAPPLTSALALLNACVSQAAMAVERIDLTERAIKSQQFEEADKLKTAILQAVSHDLRTPITIIKTSASNLRQLYTKLSGQEVQEIAQTIEQETDHLDKLVGNLLDMSRLQAGALSLNLGLNDLEEIVGDIAAQQWQRTHQERIKLNFPDDLPPVSSDYGLLRQALSNIVENSLRYESAERKIEIKAEVHSREVRLKIINHGETIPDSSKSEIMKPFYRGRDGHIGLGLPIANGIIEAHRGHLWVEDTPEGGATFVIALPLDKDLFDETENSGRG